MARATKEQSEATASSILQTAGRLFGDHGYAAIGLERVAAEAGVTRGAVYHHYGSKRDLFVAVLADVQASVAGAVAAAAPGDGWEDIVAGCLAFVRASVAPEIRRIMLVEAPAVVGWTEWRRLDREASGRLLEEGLRAQSDLAIDPAAAVALLNGAMNEGALWIAEGGDAAAIEDGLVRLLESLKAH